jgi:hypothetical protein
MSADHQMGLHGGRLFALAWLGVYPIVTLVSWLFGDALLTMPLLIRTLVLSGLMVGYMVFFWIPFIQRFRPARERGGGNVSIEPWAGAHPGSASSKTEADCITTTGGNLA